MIEIKNCIDLNSTKIKINEELKKNENNHSKIKLEISNCQMFYLRNIFMDCLDNIVSLKLIDCRLNYIHEETFTNLTNLRSLNLKRNRLTNLDENMLQNNEKLKVLNVSENQLKEISYYFTGLENLKYLNLFSNLLEKFQNFSLDNLTYLNLSKNRLEKFENVFTPKLIYLNLSFNRLSELKHCISSHSSKHNGKPLFGSLLCELDLSFNLLKNLNENIFKCSFNLKKLCLCNNNFHNFSDDLFDCLISMEKLCANYNGLTVLKNRWFQYCHSIIELSFDFNSIWNIENQTFSNLNRLETLNLSFNKVKACSHQLVLRSGLFRLNKKLAFVYLSKSQISEIEENVFYNLQSLKILDLSGNLLTDLPKDFLSGCNFYLNLLTLANNPLGQDKPFCLRPNFENMHQFISTIEFLDLSTTSITQFNHYSFNGLNIECLSLAHNVLVNTRKIRAFSTFDYSLIQNLKSLNFSYNYVRANDNFLKCNLFATRYNCLKKLMFKYCMITEISTNFFNNLITLTILNLSNNFLRELGECLRPLFNLECLDLNSNLLRNFSNNPFILNSRLNYLNLKSNENLTVLDYVIIKDIKDVFCDKQCKIIKRVPPNE